MPAARSWLAPAAALLPPTPPGHAPHWGAKEGWQLQATRAAAWLRPLRRPGGGVPLLLLRSRVRAGGRQLTRGRGTASRAPWRPAGSRSGSGGEGSSLRASRLQGVPGARKARQAGRGSADAIHAAATLEQWKGAAALLATPSMHPSAALTMAAGGRFFWNLARRVPTLPWARVTCTAQSRAQRADARVRPAARARPEQKVPPWGARRCPRSDALQ